MTGFWVTIQILMRFFPLAFSDSKEAFFSKKADVVQYRQNSSIQWNWAMDSLKAHPIPVGSQVLDVGSGDGKITAEISREIGRGSVTGVDISKEMIDFAQEEFPKAKFSNLNFLLSDILQLDLIDKFDFVVSFSCLSWVKDQEAALKKIYYALRGGGKALLVLPGHSTSTFRHFSDELKQTPHWKSLFGNHVNSRKYYSPDQYKILLYQTGFSKVDTRQEDTTTWFENRDAVARWLEPVSPTVQFLPEGRRQEFLKELLDAYLLKFPADGQGRVSVHWPKLEAFAVK